MIKGQVMETQVSSRNGCFRLMFNLFTKIWAGMLFRKVFLVTICHPGSGPAGLWDFCPSLLKNKYVSAIAFQIPYSV